MDEVAAQAGVTRLIVYRHFATKEMLYRSVLATVTGDLRDGFRAGTATGGRPAMVLAVARRHPDAFRLLWRHALHESPFADEAAAFRAIATNLTGEILGPIIADTSIGRWASVAVVEHLFGGICAWLDDGDPERDAAFVTTLTDGVRAMVTAWATAAPAAS